MNVDPRISNALVTVVVGLIGIFGVLIEYWAKKLVQANFTAKQIQIAQDVAIVIVDAVEEMGAAGIIDYKSKFAAALRRVKDLAASKGVVFSDEQWGSFLEAAVASMKSLGEEIKKAPAA
jgi:hypothetical protein